MDRERIFFYLRLLFLPIIIPLSLVRAWTSSWPSLERTHQQQEARYQRMLALLPPPMRAQVEAGQAESIANTDLRRFTAVMGDYAALRPRLDDARKFSMKSQFLNLLDAGERRLRLAESREQQAVQALPKRRQPKGRPVRRRRSR